MQLMCDALAVLGSRHGLMLDPLRRRCGLIRFGTFGEVPEFELRAGIVIDGVEHVFPLCADGAGFDFLDQRLTPCTISFTGLLHTTATKVKLTIATPFRPRDAEFSTTPVLALRLEAAPMDGHYRWSPPKNKLEQAEIFLEIRGPGLELANAGADACDLRFTAKTVDGVEWGRTAGKVNQLEFPQHDRLVALAGGCNGTRFSRTVKLDAARRDPLEIAWCTHSGPVLEVQKTRCPFRYARRLPDLESVVAWARRNPGEIFANAARVDGIVGANNLAKSHNDLLAQTLHSWLINTWWVRRPDGREWFSVWEGNCYFHSTVDVEYTQAPFYLALWPELLGLELDQWPDYARDGAVCLGEAGAGTLFQSHDCGAVAQANEQAYHHDMEVEETSNYLILLYAYWRRSGDAILPAAKRAIIEKYLAFLKAADTTGNGVPDRGVSNTVDDGSPAIQYGKKQVYLAVKTAAAFISGAALLEAFGDGKAAKAWQRRGKKIFRLVEDCAWCGDHYAVLLDKSAKGVVNPWTGKELPCAEVPGWDSPHIYTANGIAVLDMVGFVSGLNRKRLVEDLRHATRRCLREYGCVHTDFSMQALPEMGSVQGLAGVALNPGWISMNMLRDIAAFYRGVDLRALTDRYWQWQVTVNTQAPHGFFETFNGNNLHFYPRGVAVWGSFDALAGMVIDRVAGIDRTRPAFPEMRLPRLLTADWAAGTCDMVES